MSSLKVTLADVEAARSVLKDILEPTPLLPNRWLSEQLGCQVFLKLENMQPIGSFKIRGATYKISRLSAEKKKRGIVTASAGNHAQGVAWGCTQYGIKATIVMPEAAALTKIENTEALGAQIILHGNNLDEAQTYATALARRQRATYIHAFEDHDIIAGQGTVGLELIDQLPDMDVVISSMGGGGLLAGVGTVLKAFRPHTEVVGAQASGARALAESLRAGRVVSMGIPETFADGIKLMKASPAMVSILKKVVDRTCHASDEAIAAAVLTLMEKAKVVAEGSGALPLAILESLRKEYRGKKVVLIVSGGNIDVNVLSRIIDRGLIQTGRRVRVNVFISDRPGSLNRLTGLIADHGASVIQAIHDRTAAELGIVGTGVELTLETRGPKFTEALIRALRKQVARLEVLH